jgi:hypothetical protein
MTGSRRSTPRRPVDTSCDAVSFSTALSSPDPSVLARLKPGDCLRISLETENRKQIVVAWLGQDPAGSISNTYQIRLAECLETGEPFHAIVESISGGRCSVRIAHGRCG